MSELNRKQLLVRLATHKKKTCLFADPSPLMLVLFSPIVLSPPRCNVEYPVKDVNVVVFQGLIEFDRVCNINVLWQSTIVATMKGCEIDDELRPRSE